MSSFSLYSAMLVNTVLYGKEPALANSATALVGHIATYTSLSVCDKAGKRLLDRTHWLPVGKGGDCLVCPDSNLCKIKSIKALQQTIHHYSTINIHDT